MIDFLIGIILDRNEGVRERYLLLVGLGVILFGGLITADPDNRAIGFGVIAFGLLLAVIDWIRWFGPDRKRRRARRALASFPTEQGRPQRPE